jgi:3-oxoacid CoA-transferase
LPVTGKNVVDLIITELCVFEVLPDNQGLLLVELQPGVQLEEVIQKTGCNFKTTSD